MDLTEIKYAAGTGDYFSVYETALRFYPSDSVQIAAVREGNDVMNCLIKYHQDAATLRKKYPGNTMQAAMNQLILGKNEYAQNDLHGEYFTNLENCLKRFDEAMERVSEDPDFRTVLADKIVPEFLKKASQDEKYIEFCLDADDYMIHNSVKYMSTGVLKACYEDFTNRGKSQRLPNQEKLYKEMIAELRSRGEDVDDDSLITKIRKLFKKSK